MVVQTLPCPNCQNSTKIDTEPTVAQDRIRMFSIEKRNFLDVSATVCPHCGRILFYNTIQKELSDTNLYRSKYLMNIEYCTVQRSRQKELLSQEICQVDRLPLLQDENERVFFMGKRFVRATNRNKVQCCISCDKTSWETSLVEIYDEENRPQYVCPEHTHRGNGFFGYKFRVLRGRARTKNPFERAVGIELETVGGEEFTCGELPDKLRGLVASKYDGSLYESNYRGEEDDDGSAVNNRDYQQDDNNDNRGAGRELVTIPLAQDKLFNVIDDLCRFAKKKDCNVNKSCGFHVHFDMKKETIETARKTYLLYSIFEEVLFNFLPKSRRVSRYCLPLKKNYPDFFSKEFPNYWYDTKNNDHIKRLAHDKYNHTRYVSINYHALFYHGTLENRMHCGTINPTKIKNWILLNHIIIDYAKSTDMLDLIRMRGTKEALYNIIRLYEKRYPVLTQYNLIPYFQTRYEHFCDGKNDPIRVLDDLRFPTTEEYNKRRGLQHIFSNI